MVEKIKTLFSSITIVHVATLMIVPLSGWLLLNGVNNRVEITAMKVEIAEHQKQTALSKIAQSEIDNKTADKLNTHADKIIIINEMLAVLIQQMKYFEKTNTQHIEICKARGKDVHSLEIKVAKLKTKIEAM